MDTTKSIEELERSVWGPPTFDSHVVLNSHALRKKPINEFTIEDFRFMIGQDIGTIYLLPSALRILRDDPLVEDYHYPGELLQSVFRLPDKYWTDNPILLDEAIFVANKAIQIVQERCKEKRSQMRALYGAELDDQDCLESSEHDVKGWAENFLARVQAT